MKRLLVIGLALLAAAVLVLLVGGQVQRIDSFAPYEAPPLRLPKAMILIVAPTPDDIASRTSLLYWYRPDAIRPMFTVFVFDPAYDGLSIREVEITVNATNVVRLPNPEDGQKLAFEPYLDQDAFRTQYPGAEPRQASYMPFPESPLLGHPPTPGTKVTFRVDLDILVQGRAVCSTNYQADFLLEREETRTSWALMILGRLFLPKF